MSAIAIIGAGLAGISAARSLREAGHEVIIFEKSRSYGGRCATRIWEGNVVDHGVQYFYRGNSVDIVDQSFHEALNRLDSNLIGEIAAPIVNELFEIEPQHSPRCYYLPGNNRLAKALAEGLPIQFEHDIASLVSDGAGWRIGEDYFDAVISSAPWPQSAKLFGMESVDDELHYHRCLTAFYLIEGSPSGRAAEFYGIRDRSGGPISWTACENHKRNRIVPNETILVVQTSHDFSVEHWDVTGEEWTKRLQTTLAERWSLSETRFQKRFSHRWRFSRAQRSISPSLPPGIYLTGDSMVTSNVRSVWRSGVETAKRVLAQLNAT